MILRITSIKFTNNMFIMEGTTPLSKSSPNILAAYLGVFPTVTIRQIVRMCDVLLTTLMQIEQKHMMKLYRLIGVV